jgi:uncharacterized protein (DUF305 family)
MKPLSILGDAAGGLVRVAVFGLMLSAAPALAQHSGAEQSGGGHRTKDHGAAKAASPVTQAFERVNERMHKDMALALTGDADHDFAQSMIPHHQGAIDMARIVLEHGKDPEIRKLAQDVIAAQEQEIAELKQWLARHPR